MIEKEEIQRLQKFISSYRKLYAKMENMEKILTQLQKEKNDLLNELEYTRQEEIQFTATLVEKYGSDYINIKEVQDAISSDIRS